MPRQCQRPDCSDRAAVAYRFDAQRQIVVLDGLADSNSPASGVLCARHASAMVLPKGWWLDDRRVARPSLFAGNRAGRESDVAVPPRVRRPRRPRAAVDGAPGSVAGGADLTAAGVETPAPEVTEAVELPLEGLATPVEAPPEPAVGLWTPSFDVQDDLDGLLRAESPLLSRAFGGRARKGKNPPRG
ncbi:MAG: hypothetical protein JWL70_346 [Acidimicrobiia bacterium]|nr:hypothetical protein [Acidimicrobiia bacterium]